MGFYNIIINLKKIFNTQKRGAKFTYLLSMTTYHLNTQMFYRWNLMIQNYKSLFFLYFVFIFILIKSMSATRELNSVITEEK